MTRNFISTAPTCRFRLPGAIVLAIFLAAMIGGGIIYVDAKARGFHEGYLVTPITKFELILGFNLSGALKAIRQDWFWQHSAPSSPESQTRWTLDACSSCSW